MGRKLKFKVGDKVQLYGVFYYIIKIKRAPVRACVIDGRISIRPKVGRPRKNAAKRVYYKINKKFRATRKNKVYSNDIYAESDKLTLVKKNGLEKAIFRANSKI